MRHELSPAEVSLALDDGSGMEVHVRPLAFAEFDLRLSQELEELVDAWPSFHAPTSFRRERATWKALRKAK